MFIAGINPTQVWTSSETPPFAKGALGAGHDGKLYRFAQCDSGGATGAGYVVVLEPSGSADMVDTTNSAPGDSAGMPVGVAMAAVAASGYGWFCVYGMGVPVQVSASCAKGTLVNTTATSGQLDDDATAGAEVIQGLALEAARAATAGTANASLSFPHIGRTL